MAVASVTGLVGASAFEKAISEVEGMTPGKSFTPQPERVNMSNIASSSARQQHRNEVHLRGILARDPEIRYTPSGKAVANFTIATTYEKRTEWHKCVAWEEHAEKLSESFHKGDYIRIVGRLQTRSWDDKQAGQKKYVTEVIVFQIATPDDEPAPLTPDPARKSGTQAARAILSPAKATEKNAHGVEVSDDDIPF